MHALVVKAEGFGHPFALVVAGADAMGVDVAAIALGLGMDLGIAVDLGRAGEQQPRPDPAGQAQHVVGADEAGFGRFDRVVLVVHRRGRAGQVPDAVHLQADRLGHVVADQFEIGVADPLGQIGLAPREVVVEADHLFTSRHQPVHQVGTDKAGAAGDQVAHGGSHGIGATGLEGVVGRDLLGALASRRSRIGPCLKPQLAAGQLLAEQGHGARQPLGQGNAGPPAQGRQAVHV